MKTTTKIFSIAALSLLTASSVFAEQASDSVDAKAGLAPALELSCTDVSFGVWRVPVRSSGGTTTITLDRANDTVAASGNTTRVAQSNTDISWDHSRGECTLSGSTAADATAATITIASNTDMAFTAANAATTGYVGLDAATAAASMTASLNVPNTTTITSGSSTFYVGGVLTIPQAIIADNYGGYKTSSSATITANDLVE